MSAVRLELVVLSYNGQALAAPLSRALDAPVSIGRGSDNDLPLNDPERLISRHQARLSMGPAGTVDLSNLSSSSSLFINGNELAPGRSCTLSPSDQLLVGRYVLGLRPASLPAAPPAMLPRAPAEVSVPMATPSATAPVAAPARPAPPRPVPVPAANPMATRPRPVQTIPDDFDVFSPPMPPPAFGLPVGDVVIEDLSEKAAVRDIFSELQTLGNDVLAEPDDEARQRQRALDTNRNPLDPLEMLKIGGDDSAASVSLDHGLEIDSLFVLPSLVPEGGLPSASAAATPAASYAIPPPTPAPRMPPQPQPAVAPPAAVAAPTPASSVAAAERMMADLLESGPALDPATAITTFDNLPMIESPPPAAVRAPPAAAPSTPRPAPPPIASPAAAPPAPPPRPAPPPVASPAAAPAAAAPRPASPAPPMPAAAAPATPVDQDAAAILRAAFARGCGVDIHHISEFTPQAMEVLGRIVAAMTAGTIRLMHGRSSTKHEMRANVTIIATDGNNPLKFAPDGAAALTQLLGRGSPGFMPPLRAIDDAFDDLSAHQVGLLAGSRAAMYDVATMLGPERFLARAGEKSGLETMMPAKHKARLWDLYESGYQEMVGEAREEFENLFQRAFARAYEQEIDRINTGKSR
jgi:FHA domain-containing protein